MSVGHDGPTDRATRVRTPSGTLQVAEDYRTWAEGADQRPREDNARMLEQLARDVEALPASEQPYAGWAPDLADLHRHQARRCRGEDVGLWKSPQQRRDEAKEAAQQLSTLS